MIYTWTKAQMTLARLASGIRTGNTCHMELRGTLCRPNLEVGPWMARDA